MKDIVLLTLLIALVPFLLANGFMLFLMIEEQLKERKKNN